ncbi:hypothetical protein B9G69_010160 [Bdellovibrio sp. SKB1291214]|uniref:hypothetical protein n=1 Tax=Bdellovibrio sp. SKB1291214 TaxID=1732569 RepID=UPI000B51E2EE|nr:hypothetical protein [Bdellovibrio sp. SKB1291214]UYL07408.1 hypothetical protein B9G69_010160 [Bdellovibrio sp. SKB1291214]
MENELKNLYWIEDLLLPGYDCAPKHGGMAYYVDMKLVMILVERKGLYEHKGVSYPFELWNGAIFPVEKKAQNAFFLKYLFLENHPANKDWLYIPAESEDFEDQVKQMIREVNKPNPLLGLTVKFDGPKVDGARAPAKKKAAKKVRATKKSENAYFLSIAKKK